MFTLCAATLLLACNNNGDKTKETATDTATAAVRPSKEEAWIPVDSATAAKAWMEYAMPGEAHQSMAKSDGKWTGEVTMWAMGPDKPSTTSTSEVVNKMVMGGRYQMSSFNGSFMGMPFEGMSITGYDNHKNKFVSTWIDNMGTGIMSMEGTLDAATKTITMTGKMTDVTTGKECDMKEIFRNIDDHHQIMEMYGPDPQTGKQYKTMEIKYTRK